MQMRLLVTPARPRDAVARRWYAQYADGGNWPEYGKPWGRTKRKTYDALMALPQDATADAVDEVIGNKSWTHEFCSSCSEYHRRAIKFGEDYSGATVCEDCLRTALAMLRPADSSSDTP